MCIEVEDEDDIKEISMSLSDVQANQSSSTSSAMPSVSAPLYMDVWPDQQSQDNGAVPETETTPLHSLPGINYPATSSSGQDLDASTGHPFPIAGSLTATSQAGLSTDSVGTQDQSALQGWEVQMQEGLLDGSLVGQALPGGLDKSSPQKVGFPLQSF